MKTVNNQMHTKALLVSGNTESLGLSIEFDKLWNVDYEHRSRRM